MPLKLEIVSEHREIVGDDAVREFREEGGTIGRSLNNDWILPDPDKFISGKHATIDCKGGIYYLADISTNGVYINDERRAYRPAAIRGACSTAITCTSATSRSSLRSTRARTWRFRRSRRPSVVPDNIEQLVPEEHLKTGIQLLDEDEITGDEEFQNVLFGKG